MNYVRHTDLLDTVLTLRGHQITLRQALAEGIIKGLFDRGNGRAEVHQVDPRWLVDGSRRAGDA